MLNNNLLGIYQFTIFLHKPTKGQWNLLTPFGLANCTSNSVKKVFYSKIHNFHQNVVKLLKNRPVLGLELF